MPKSPSKDIADSVQDKPFHSRTEPISVEEHNSKEVMTPEKELSGCSEVRSRKHAVTLRSFAYASPMLQNNYLQFFVLSLAVFFSQQVLPLD